MVGPSSGYYSRGRIYSYTTLTLQSKIEIQMVWKSFLLWNTSFKFAVYILILTQMGPFYTSYILTLILILNILHLTDTDCWTNSAGSNISLMFILLKPQA